MARHDEVHAILDEERLVDLAVALELLEGARKAVVGRTCAKRSTSFSTNEGGSSSVSILTLHSC